MKKWPQLTGEKACPYQETIAYPRKFMINCLDTKKQQSSGCVNYESNELEGVSYFINLLLIYLFIVLGGMFI